MVVAKDNQHHQKRACLLVFDDIGRWWGYRTTTNVKNERICSFLTLVACARLWCGGGGVVAVAVVVSEDKTRAVKGLLVLWYLFVKLVN